MQIKKQPSSSPSLNNSVPTRNLRTKGLRKYVWGSVGILLLFWATFPLAYWRVAQSEKFEGQPFKSLTWTVNQKDNLAYPEAK